MEQKRKILNQIVAFEEFRQMITDGFLPGQLSLEESVRYFDILKNRSFEENYSGVEPVTGKRYEADLSREDFLEIFPGDVSYELMKDAFIRYGIPLTKDNVKEVSEAVRLALEIEEIPDGMCEFIIRNGVCPSIENMHKLRFERERILPSESAMAEETDYECIAAAGLDRDDFTVSMVRFMREKSLLITPSNLRMLYHLWTLNVPVEEEEALRIAVSSMRQGMPAKDGLLVFLPEADKGTESTEKEPENGPGEMRHVTSSGEEELRRLEAQYRQEFLRKNSEEEYFAGMYEEYKKIIATHTAEAEILERLGIEMTPDYLWALGKLLSGMRPDEKNIWEELSGVLSEEDFSRIVNEYSSGSFIDLPGGISKRCMEYLRQCPAMKEIQKRSASPCENIPEDGAEEKCLSLMGLWKQLILLDKLEEKGYFEKPVLWEMRPVSVFLHEDENKEITVKIMLPGLGAILIKACRPLREEMSKKYFEKEDPGQRIIIAAGENEIIDIFLQSDPGKDLCDAKEKNIVSFVSQRMKNDDFLSPFDK